MTSNYDSRYLEDLSDDIEPFMHGTSISGEEEEEGEKLNPRTSPSRPWFCKAMHVLILIFTIFLGVVVFSILVSDSKSSKVPTAPKPQNEGGSKILAHCGTNPEEAQARGCVWDIMSFGWVHPTCFNQEESDSWYAEYGPWEWYTEKPGNETDAVRLTPEQLPFTPLVYTTQGYHIQHCLYILKNIHIAAMNSGPVTNEGITLGHTEHCIKLMANPDVQPFEDVVTRVHLLFIQCVTLT
jgi:hypothetical protein